MVTRRASKIRKQMRGEHRGRGQEKAAEQERQEIKKLW
jgi:hypothetical protein